MSLEGDVHSGEALLQPVMRDGRRLGPVATLADARQRAASDLERLPDPLRNLREWTTYSVQVADALRQLAAEVDHRLAQSPDTST
jgi:nicotinate phosphoribosyltransferase